jgi:hypothetical protein
MPANWFDDELECLYAYEGHPNGGPNDWVFLDCPALCRCRSCGRPGYSDADPLVISIDGACVGNGMDASRAAMGVCFSEGDDNLGSVHNISTCTNDRTSQQVELSTAIAPLKQYARILNDGQLERDRSILLKSDSAYLVDGTTSRIMN